ncbi:Nn.00g051260.m01.CDS01 [Neocucurbitaria sp. VM-36]
MTASASTWSLFFKKALTGNWKEAEERVVKLPEDTPSVFATHVHHLYTGELAVRSDDLEHWPMFQQANLNLCHLYVLAERLQDIQTKNAILSRLFEMCREKQSDVKPHYPGKRAISIIYNGTTSGSHARKLLVDLWTYNRLGSWNVNVELPKEFCQELLYNLMDKRSPPSPNPTKVGTCAAYMEEEGKDAA